MTWCVLHRHTLAHIFSVAPESCIQTGEDEMLSRLTVLDRNLWMRMEEMQCVSRRLTCDMSLEPLVILAHYNIPDSRTLSLESIGLFSRPQWC